MDYNNYIKVFIFLFMAYTPASAFMEHFFQQQQQQQHNQQQDASYQDRAFGKDCTQYLCPDTLKCVRRPVDCPCPFPDSQIKCVLPAAEKGRENTFVCISKGSKDCKYVLDAHKGLI